eukprot:TRINITY_DN13308_c0_g1_i1.p1 TRINITY_DN13308_c0_g1~~TRINITY_DN13308_c0_g1_i1.p1  ORF type:complete len:477 (+),score=78.41 TRINITY_DN13308_c0_g1_i1:31-1431(+)
MEGFSGWALRRGIVISDIMIGSTLEAGHGLIATRTLDEGSTVLRVPSASFLSLPNLLQGPYPLFKEALRNLYARRFSVDLTEEEVLQCACDGECEVISLFLAYCKSVGEASEWRGYMEALPTVQFFKENHVLFNVDCVLGTSLEGSTRAKLAKLERQWKEWQEAEGTWLAEVDWETLLWADCIFWSRAVDIGGGREDTEASTGEGSPGLPDGDPKAPPFKMALVPYFDIANHSLRGWNMRWQLYDGGLELVTCNQKVQSKQELYLNYGEKSNQELLFVHGFCIENNPEPSVVTLPVLPFLNPEADPINLPKLLWLKSIGAPLVLKLNKTDNPNIGQLNQSACGWSKESIQLMYLVVLEEDDIVFEEGVCKLEGSVIHSLEDLERSVLGLASVPLVQLRVVMCLLEVVEHFMQEKEELPANSTGIWRQVSIYRQEEHNIFTAALQALLHIRDTLSLHPIVLSYLENN